MYRPWRLPGSSEVRALGRGRCGRTVLARLDGPAAELVVVRYVPAGPLIHRPRAAAFHADVARLAGLRVPAVVPFLRYVPVRRVAAAYARSAGAVGGALVSHAVEGVSLARVVERHGALPTAAAFVVFRRVLSALNAAHDRGLVHGDLRPAKVLIDRTGSVAVTGLGLAALTTGPPALRAPELWRGPGTATPAADVYAAACLFHLCLTGRLPFPERELFTLMCRHTTAPVPSEGVLIPLRGTHAAGLTKDPALRPPARALLGRLVWTAEAEYFGRDWKERGRAQLRSVVTPLVEALPRT